MNGEMNTMITMMEGTAKKNGKRTERERKKERESDKRMSHVPRNRKISYIIHIHHKYFFYHSSHYV